MDIRSLSGAWQFRAATDDDWHGGTVPGDVYTDLHGAGVIEDPYDADVELDVQWVGETDWVYRRTFAVDEALLEHDVVVLQCLGVDTVSAVALNGTTVGETDNMHRAYEFDVASVLEAGENTITVSFTSPVAYAARRQNDHPYDLPAIRYPVDQPGRNFIRKAQCHFGWDWGPCLPGVGIWRDVRIVAYSGPRITYVTTDQTHHEDGDVTLAVRTGIDAPRAESCDLSIAVAGVEHRSTASLSAGENEVTCELTVADPDRWWPNGYGDQPLYDLEVTATGVDDGDTFEERIGFRDLRLVREPDRDDDGESFFFEVNGVPVYAKGANWIPTEAVPGRVETEQYDELLGSAVEANMNTIRVWGGGHYERDAFYERCDELGLLVWQDFMFACAVYPADEAFLDSVEAEARYQVRRLANHPSIALWCGNNENEMSLSSWFSDADHLDQLREDYDALYLDTIGSVVEAEDPSRSYWPASPSSGTDELDPYRPSRGDVHYWNVWHDGEPFSNYLTVEPRFVSEFGYQSFASTELLAEVVPEDQLNPSAPLMEHHQRHPRGNQLILSQLAENFRVPFDFERFVYLSQVQQALAMQIAIEHWRRLKPYCMGTLYWQLNDLWPCASWSSIEYGGRWKALQHVARRFYAPVLLSTIVDGDDVEVWITSDRTEALSGRLSIVASTFDGEVPFEREMEVAVEPLESSCVATLSIENDLGGLPPDRGLLRADFDGDGETYPSFAFLEPYRRLDLPETELSVAVDGTDVVVEAPSAALFVALAAPSVSGHFSDNVFHLAAGERKRVTFFGDEVDAASLESALEVTHLGETY